ncbi:MAG: DUF2067 family protein [Sulfolobales archaeon]
MEVRLKLKCGNPAACSELAEFISKSKGVRSTQTIYEVRNGILNIDIFGSPNEVLSSKKALLKAYEEWRRIKEFESGRSSGLNVRTLSALVGRPTIPDVVVFLLRNQGYSAELQGDVLVTNAPATFVLDLAREVSMKLEEVSKEFPRASRNLKALLVALSVLGYDARSLLQHLIQMGLVEENHKLKLNTEWSSLLAKIVHHKLRVSESEAGSKEG